MNTPVHLSKRMPRGAIPSPRHVLAAAVPHSPDPTVSIPRSFLMWPVRMSYWGNDVFGDCVSAEEAFAKATASPQKYFPDATITAWATATNFLNGAAISSVLNEMQNDGFPAISSYYNDGPYNSVDWTNSTILQDAISQYGPVKLGVAAGHFDTNAHGHVTPGSSGWAMYGYPAGLPADHCVGICGYGRLQDLISLFQQHGVSINPPSGMPDDMCYAMFTWNSIGIIDQQSLLNMTNEAWVRKPVTVIEPPPILLTSQGNWGIWRFDRNSKTPPSQIASTNGLGLKGMVRIPNTNTLYLTTHKSYGLWTYDLATRATPTQIPGTSDLGFSGIIKYGDLLYLTTHGNYGIWTFGITTQAKPTQIPSTDGLGLRGIVQVDELFYLTSPGKYGLWTFDPESQQTPIQVKSTAERDLGLRGIIKVGSLLYLTTHGKNGLWIFDTETKKEPIQIASTKGLSFREGLQIGNTLYLTTDVSDGIWTFDITSQSKPVQIPGTANQGFDGIIQVDPMGSGWGLPPSSPAP